MKAGDYRDRLEWLKRTRATKDGFGAPVETYPSQGYLWCAVEEVTANRESVKDAQRQVTTATIRVRNFPAIGPGDRLSGGGFVWSVLTAVAGDNETTCEVDDVTR